MPRPTWADEMQTAFMKDRQRDFIDAQANGTTRAFFNAVTETFNQHWAVDEPTAEEIAENDGDIEAARRAKAAQRRGQIEWWFRNRARANATGKANASSAVLPLTRKKPQPLIAYQAYMHLFSERVMPELRERYKAYVATLPEGEEARDWWGFACGEAARMLHAEADSVKAEVDSYRQQLMVIQDLFGIDFEVILKDHTPSATEKVRALQKAINLLARTAYEALKAIEEKTGFKGTILLGGPSPEAGRLVTLAIHNGRTSELNNIFSEATESWGKIQSEWETFIARSFPPDLAEKLHKIFKGEHVADTPGASTSSAPTSDSATSTASASTPAPSPSTSTNSSAATSALTATTSTTAADAPPVSSSATPPTSAPRKPGYAVPSLDYDRQLRANKERNARFMARIEAGETLEDITANPDKEVTKVVKVPGWIAEAQAYLESVSREGWWRALVAAWLNVEKGLEYPEGQSQSNWLPSKLRPEEVKFWTSRGRNYEKPPKIKSLPAFVSAFRQWWARLQPAARRENGAVWPLLRSAPATEAAWSSLRRGGCNGIFMVLMCLSWWFAGLKEGEDTSELRAVVEDVTWVCTTMVPPITDDTVDAASTPTRAPTPAAAEKTTSLDTTVVDEQTTALTASLTPGPAVLASAQSPDVHLPLAGPSQAVTTSAAVPATSTPVINNGGDVVTAAPESVEDVNMDVDAVNVGSKRCSPEPQDSPETKKAKVVA